MAKRKKKFNLKHTLRSFAHKIKKFFRKYGIDGILSIVLWYSPSWLMFLIPSLNEFGTWWFGVWITPATPLWAILPAVAALIHVIRLGIWKLILWIRDQLDKIRMANELLAYANRSEIRLILSKMKEINKDSRKKIAKFMLNLQKERISMINSSWKKKK